MQYLSLSHQARMQLGESKGNSTETLSKDPRKLTVISIAVLPVNSSILEHSCYTSDTTDLRQATGINAENRTSRGLCNVKLNVVSFSI